MSFSAHRRGEILKSVDRYAKSVTLTYLKSGTYRTPIGGCCTIISFLILFYWLVVNIFYSLANHGSYSVQSQTSRLQDASGNYPVFELSQTEFLVSYELVNITSLSSPLDKYLEGVWVQVNANGTLSYYTKTPCKNIFPEGSVDKIFYSQIEDQLCPDMRGEPVRLQNIVQKSKKDTVPQKFYFLVDTCESLAPITGTTGCVADSVVKAQLVNFMVNVKRANQNFSPKTYIENGNEMTTYFHSDQIVLSNAVSNQFEWNLKPTTNLYTDAILYTDQLMQDIQGHTHTLVNYQQVSGTSLSTPYSDYAQISRQNRFQRLVIGAPTGSPLVLKFHQAESEQTNSQTRRSLSDVF